MDLEKMDYKSKRVSVSSNAETRGAKSNTENRGCYHYLGVQRPQLSRPIDLGVQRPQLSSPIPRIAVRNSVRIKKRMKPVECPLVENLAIENSVGSKKRIVKAVAGFGGMNQAIEDSMGSKTRIRKAVAGFGDFTSIDVDIKKEMVTVVGKSVPVSVALKVREMGYRAKLLSLGPATEEKDTDDSLCYGKRETGTERETKFGGCSYKKRGERKTPY